ncbi:S8 family serine peptidase [Kribbella lupini]|uniref:Peptidase S8/S53 domain-containing protein n=1 Tax=Kribbella lupini TaxID=291602 RepID=A0ABP4LDU5_9ACTN
MIDHRRTGFLLLTLAAGEGREYVPAQLDVLVGAARPSVRLTGGRLDRLLSSYGGAFRATAVYHSRRNLGRVGTRSTGYDDLEEQLGLSRTYRLELADPSQTDRVLDSARDLGIVENVCTDRLALTSTVAVDAPLTREDVLAPYAMVRSEEAHAVEPGDERVVVAVVDSGVSLGHSELQRKLLSGYDVVDLGTRPVSTEATLLGDSTGLDFAPMDDLGHGSHVAGVIGAQGWQLPRGVGGRSMLLPVRVLAAATVDGEPAVTGIGAISDIDVGLKVAVDLGADVLNMSFGTPATGLEPGDAIPHRAVLAYARSNGCVLVAAAGNSGLEENYYPAADPNVISVGSVGPDRTRSTFSTYGGHLALSAPGERIVGVGRRGYRRASGTSHAAPFVAGAAALLLAHARRQGRTLGADDVKSLLTGSAQRSHSPPDEVGAGVLDVAAALALLDQQLSHPQGDRP